MAIELRPYGMRCKAPLCEYCYQRGNKPFPYSGQPMTNKMLDDIKKQAEVLYEKYNDNVILFGGDPGAYDEKVLKDLIKWSQEKFGKASLQTGGWWITEEWLDWLKNYKVHFGLSMDGPWPLNEKRKLKNTEETKKYTDRLMRLLPRMVKEQWVGMIITLHDSNVSPERYNDFKDWLLWLDNLRIGGRMHLLQHVNNVKIDPVRLKGVMVDLAQFVERLKCKWTPFSDIPKVLGYEKGTGACIWNNCDPYYTSAVKAIDRDGISICSRNFKEGLRPLKADNKINIRQEILKNTPQNKLGCKDCEWFEYCGGFCPGTAINGDWRNRSVHCEVIKILLSYYKGKYEIQKDKDITLKPKINKKDGWHTDGDTKHGDVSHGDSFRHDDS